MLILNAKRLKRKGSKGLEGETVDRRMTAEDFGWVDTAAVRRVHSGAKQKIGQIRNNE
jgi:hypothetical protein